MVASFETTVKIYRIEKPGQNPISQRTRNQAMTVNQAETDEFSV